MISACAGILGMHISCKQRKEIGELHFFAGPTEELEHKVDIYAKQNQQKIDILQCNVALPTIFFRGTFQKRLLKENRI